MQEWGKLKLEVICSKGLRYIYIYIYIYIYEWCDDFVVYFNTTFTLSTKVAFEEWVKEIISLKTCVWTLNFAHKVAPSF
jgi:hypothetical protein